MREKLGTLLKIYVCTSATLRGLYARICIQVATDKPIKKEVTIRTYQQKIIYEGECILCTNRGKVGQTYSTCLMPRMGQEMRKAAPQDQHSIGQTR